MGQTEPSYVRNPDFIFRKVADDFILVPIHQQVADMNCLYTLNEIGAFIWEQLEKPATQADLQAKILHTYNAELDVVVADLEAFLQDMISLAAVRRD